MVINLQGVCCPGGSRGRPIENILHLERDGWSKASISGNISSDSSFSRSKREEEVHLARTGWQQTWKLGQRRQEGRMLGQQASSLWCRSQCPPCTSPSVQDPSRGSQSAKIRIRSCFQFFLTPDQHECMPLARLITGQWTLTKLCDHMNTRGKLSYPCGCKDNLSRVSALSLKVAYRSIIRGKLSQGKLS